MTGPRYRIESFYLLHFDSIIVHKQQTRVIPGLLHVGTPSLSLSLARSRAHTHLFPVRWCSNAWMWWRWRKFQIDDEWGISNAIYCREKMWKNTNSRWSIVIKMRDGDGEGIVWANKCCCVTSDGKLMGNLIFSLSCKARKKSHTYEESIRHCV